MSSARHSVFAAILGLAAALPAGAAFAAPATPAPAKSAPKGGQCQILTFSVNDYGKDGPSRDAQALLDKHIVDWTAAKGVKKYKVGKKDVQCDLFLDFVVFNEYTCKASAKVCW